MSVEWGRAVGILLFIVGCTILGSIVGCIMDRDDPAMGRRSDVPMREMAKWDAPDARRIPTQIEFSQGSLEKRPLAT